MTDRDTLLRLADECEKAKGPDRELDARIADAVGWRDVLYEGYGTWRGIRPSNGRRQTIPSFTRSLDAAMTLVPEGCAVLLQTVPAEGFAVSQVGGEAPAKAATPALALCAAALRARAGEAE